MIAVEELADQLGVDPGDVRVLLAQLGEHADTIRYVIGAEIRDPLNHFGERTVPGLWWPGSDPDAGRDATKMR
jgi:hypothetical protein